MASCSHAGTRSRTTCSSRTGGSRPSLAQWGQTRDAPRSLDECYAERLEWLSAASPAELPCWVTGKAVLKVLLERIPVDSGPRPAAITLVNIYMSHYPAPSDEHVTLVERILGRI